MDDRTTRVPLMMFDLTGQGKEEANKTSKENKVPRTQVSIVEHPTKEVFDIVPLQTAFLEIGKGSISKTIKS